MSACGCSSACAPPTEVPIACSLSLEGQAERAAEFEAVFAHLQRTEDLADGFRWHFNPAAGLERLSNLARRERECCPFFDFRVERSAGSIVWDCRASEAASAVLNGFKRLPETLRREPRVERAFSSLLAESGRSES